MDLECSVCFEAFDCEQKQPMSLACGHTFCSSCVLELKQCPLDKRPFNKTGLAKNFMIMQLLNSGAAKHPACSLKRKCQTHGDKIKMLCLDDMEEICSECLLLNHYHHEVRSFKHYMALLESLEPRIRKMSKVSAGQSEDAWPEERQSLNGFVVGQKKRISDRIKDRFQAVVTTVNDCCASVLRQVDRIFQMNERVIERGMKINIRSRNSQLASLISHAVKKVESLGKVDIKRLDKDKIVCITDTVSFIESIEEMHSKAFDKSAVIDLAAVTQTISENILDAFNAYFLPIDTYLSEIIYNPSLDYFLACNSPYENSNTVLVKHSPPSLTHEDLVDLANCCSTSGKLEITKVQNSSGGSASAISFETSAEARSFLFLSSSAASDAAISLQLVDQETKKFAPRLDTRLMRLFASESNCVDTKLLSAVRDFRIDLSEEIVKTYKFAAPVERSHPGLQHSLFLGNVLHRMADCLIKSRK